MQVPGQAPGRTVVLHVELVTKRQALTLLWTVWLFLGALVGFSVALLVRFLGRMPVGAWAFPAFTSMHLL